ncbi:hypothetical protein ABTW96_12355 [Nocardia beijingensis]|uniref:hypothetical protein n=1 Tax=Nocardia beijingensis TaxID=95162 RepID=UPI003319A719
MRAPSQRTDPARGGLRAFGVPVLRPPGARAARAARADAVPGHTARTRVLRPERGS